MENIDSSVSPVFRIYNALTEGDYATTLSLWDHFILRDSDQPGFKKVLHIESLINLYLSTYPFRSEVVKLAGSASQAAIAAGRSMATFKNYVESRKDIMMKYNVVIFIKYNQIHKIAFPPTHPRYKHLFEKSWTDKTLKQIKDFLEQRLRENTDIPGSISDGVLLKASNAHFPPI